MTATSTAVATYTPPKGALAPIRYDTLNLKAVSEWAERNQRTGFAGDVITFQTGFFFNGYKAEKSKGVKAGTRFAANVANIILAWQTFEGNVPTYAEIARPFQGEDLSPRAARGDMDQSQWRLSPKDGKPMDPWRKLAVVFLRSKGELFRFETTSGGGNRAVRTLITDFVKAVMADPGLTGKLPIIELGSELVVDSKKGQNYHVPTLKIVGWTNPTALDDQIYRESVAEEVEDAAVEDEFADEAPAPAKKAAPAAPAPKKAAPPAEEAEQLDIEDVDVDPPAPAPKKKAVAAATTAAPVKRKATVAVDLDEEV